MPERCFKPVFDLNGRILANPPPRRRRLKEGLIIVLKHDKDTYIHPKDMLVNAEKLLEFANQQGWDEDELYAAVKLILAMYE